MATDPMPGAGDVELDLAGETVVLKCSAAAALSLSRQPGAIYGTAASPGVADRLMALDIDTMCSVIRAGLGLGPGAVKELPEQVYAAGLITVRGPLSVYLGALVNGGKPIQAGGDASGEENPPKG